MTGPSAQVMKVLAWLRQQRPGDAPRGDLQVDSRNIRPGDVFVALPGVTPGRADDGRRYLEDARGRGAVAALVEADGFDGADCGLPVLALSGLRQQLGTIASRYYGDPSDGLQVLAITGTNGKTSSSHFAAQLLSRCGRRCAVLGTLGGGFPGEALSDAALTTPEATGLQREILRLRTEGARALAMEVSSIALEQGRVNGTHFDVALFTNLSRDHLDYHGTMAAYAAAKARLFNWPTLTAAVLNLDDPQGRALVQDLASRVRAAAIRLIGYTVAGGAIPEGIAGLLSQVVRARDIAIQPQTTAFNLCVGADEARVEVPLLGLFNVSNLAGVVGAALACGIEFSATVRALPHLLAPPGRLQRVRSGALREPLAVVDYAHTPDALEQALQALRPVAHARGGKLWVVLGAGGDRDPGKRAPMGATASKFADRIVITSDNPRSEDPASIVAQVAAGTATRLNVELVVDRSQAIAQVLAASAIEDVVLIAGKGHEAYQEVGGQRLPFSDVEHARAALAARGVAA